MSLLQTATGVLLLLGASGNILSTGPGGGGTPSYGGTLTLSGLPQDGQIFQRDTTAGGTYGKGVGTVPITVTCSVACASLEYRIIDNATSLPVTSYVNFSGLDTSSTAPQLLAMTTAPADLKLYQAEVRANGADSSATTSSSSNRFSIGHIIATNGQSLLKDGWFNGFNCAGGCSGNTVVVTYDSQTLANVTILGGGTGVTPSDWGLMYGTGQVGGGNGSNTNSIMFTNNAVPAVPVLKWVKPAVWSGTTAISSYSGVLGGEYTRLCVATLGVPCAMIGFTVGGIGLAAQPTSCDFAPGDANCSPNYYTTFKNILANSNGRVGTVWLFVGHSDSVNGIANTVERTNVNGWFAQVQSDFPSANFKCLLSSIPSADGSIGADGDVANVRQGMLDWINNVSGSNTTSCNGNAYYVSGMDVELNATDKTHQTSSGSVQLARSAMRQTLLSLGLDSFGDTGPTISGAGTRVGNLVTFPITQAGGAAWNLSCCGTATLQGLWFNVYNWGSTGLSGSYTASAVDLSNNGQITFAISPTPPDSQRLWMALRRKADDTSGFMWGGAGHVVAVPQDNSNLNGTGGRHLTFAQTTPYNIPAITNTTTPGAPTGVVMSATNETVAVAWTAPTSGAITSWQYRESADCLTWSSAVGLSSLATSFALVGKTANTPFCYQVRGINSAAGTPTGAWSASSNGGTPLSTQNNANPALPILDGGVGASVPAGVRYDVSASNAVFSDAAMTTLATNGGTVGALMELSGQGMVARKLDCPASPVLNTASQNGLPGLLFTIASKTCLSTSPGSDMGILDTYKSMSGSGRGWTMALVLKNQSSVPVTLTNYTNQFRLQNSVLLTTSSTNAQIYRNTVGNFNAATASNVSSSAVVKLIARFDQANSRLCISSNYDTVEHCATGVPGSLTEGFQPWDAFTLGGVAPAYTGTSTSYWFGGRIYEVDFWPIYAGGSGGAAVGGNGTGTAGTDMARAWNYLNTKWGT